MLRHACCRPVVHCRTPSICAITGRQWDQVTEQLYFSQDGTENNKISFARFSIYLCTWLRQTVAACQRPQSWNRRCATCTFPETLAVKLASHSLVFPSLNWAIRSNDTSRLSNHFMTNWLRRRGRGHRLSLWNVRIGKAGGSGLVGEYRLTDEPLKTGCYNTCHQSGNGTRLSGESRLRGHIPGPVAR